MKRLDRIDAMTAFVATVDAGGFSSAARQLGRSPASITRAVAFLEERTGSPLLRRTTRALKLTEAGERYLVACRRILAELAEAEELAAGEHAVPRGTLTVTAPVAFGRIHVRPLVDTFLAANREATARLLLVDRLVSLIEEGIDVAVRIAHMPDSSLLAVKVGEVRRVVCASPDYLRGRSPIRMPSDLTGHDCLSFSQGTSGDAWSFGAGGAGRRVQVKTRPRLVANSIDAVIGSAVDGHGVTSVLSYQVRAELLAGSLVCLLSDFEPEPLPIHVVHAAASATTGRVRAFLELAVPRLRAALTPLPAPTARKKTQRGPSA